MSYGKRSFLVGPWRYCARCDEKTHIRDMTWQLGWLLCQECLDKDNTGTALIGSREQIIGLVLGDGKEELAPDIKLREPDVSATNDDIML